MNTPTRNSTILISLVAALGLCTTVDASDARGPGSTSPLVLPAGAFTHDGDNPSDYWVSGEYVQGGTSITVRAALQLPQHAHVTAVHALMRDTTGTANAHVYVKETPFGEISGTDTIWDLHSDGNNSSLQWDFASEHYTVDTAANSYWVQANLMHDNLRLYSVHVFYEQGLIFEDGFESGATNGWDEEVPGRTATAPATLAASPTSPPVTLTEIPAWMKLDNPVAQAALEDAVAGRSGYGTPLIIPGPAFNSSGYTDHDAYYLSASNGYVYTRGGEAAVLHAPVYLPDGAQISWFMAWYLDSYPTDLNGDTRVWLARMNTWTGLGEALAYDASVGENDNIRAFVFSAGDLTDAIIDYSHYSYWITIDVGATDWGAGEYNRLYAAAILYTMP